MHTAKILSALVISCTVFGASNASACDVARHQAMHGGGGQQQSSYSQTVTVSDEPEYQPQQNYQRSNNRKQVAQQITRQRAERFSQIPNIRNNLPTPTLSRYGE